MISLDHIVHAVHNRKSAESSFIRQGFHVFEGGKHEDWGTSNSLSYFGSSYIEFISIDQAEKAAISENPLIMQLTKKADEGVYQTALRTDNIEGDAVTLSKLGLQVTGPFLGSRKTEEGSTLSWKMMFVSSPHSTFELPFFIEWNQPAHLRIDRMRNEGIIKDHTNGARQISSVFYAVKDIGSVLPNWNKWFNTKKIKAYTNSQELNAICTEVKISDASFTFFEPKGEGMIKEIIKHQGEGPFGAEFKGANGSSVVHVLSGGYYSY
ncbi:VOC family protein [Peribacillus deserti]|nr:VOC family protein [Peribacillus deserti]